MISKSPIPFQSFSKESEVKVYLHGELPHWQQEGCAYFVTFRLADSIPQSVLRELEIEKTTWLKARSIDPLNPEWKYLFTKLPPEDQRAYERLIGRLINKSLDECHGSCCLRDPLIASKVAAALNHFHDSRVLTGDFVVMPNHVHALMTPINGYLLDILATTKL